MLSRCLRGLRRPTRFGLRGFPEALPRCIPRRQPSLAASTVADKSSSSVGPDQWSTGRRPNHKIPTLFQKNDKVLWQAISRADKKKSGAPIRTLAEKWAKLRHPIGVIDAVELLHAAYRFNVQLSKMSVNHIRNVLVPRKSGLYTDHLVGKLLISLPMLGFSRPVQKLIGALAPKVALCVEPLSARTFATFGSLRRLHSCPETDNLLEALLPKLTESELELEPHTISRMVVGLSSMDPSTSNCTGRYLFAVGEKLKNVDSEFSVGDLAQMYEALHRFSRTNTGLDIFEILYPKLQECEDLMPSHVTKILAGLSKPHPKNVEEDAMDRAERVVDNTLTLLQSKVAAADGKMNLFSTTDCASCLNSLPGLGDGPGARSIWSLVARKAMATERRTLEDKGHGFVLGKTLISILKWTKQLEKKSPELDLLVSTLSEMLQHRKRNGDVMLAKAAALAAGE